MFFDEIIEKFNERFDRLEKILTVLTTKVEKIEEALVDTVAVHSKTCDMFEACAKGFRQVRDACHCLREELGEAKGTIVEETWGN